MDWASAFITVIDWLLAALFLISCVLLTLDFRRTRRLSRLVSAVLTLVLAGVYTAIELFDLTSAQVAPIFRPTLLLLVAVMISRAITESGRPRR